MPFLAWTVLFDGSDLFTCTKPTKVCDTSFDNATAYALNERNLQVFIWNLDVVLEVFSSKWA